MSDPSASVYLGGAGWAVAVEAVLDRQSSVLEDLDQWATRQENCIAAGNVDELLAVLGHRQSLVEQLLSTQSELTGLTRNFEVLLQSVPAAARVRLKGRIRDVDGALQRVLERDDRDRAEMERQRCTSQDELHVLDSACRARFSYMADTQPVIDRRCADERG